MADPDLTNATVTMPFTTLEQLLDERTTAVDEADRLRDRALVLKTDLADAKVALDASRAEQMALYATNVSLREENLSLEERLAKYEPIVQPEPSETVPPTESVVPVPTT